MIENNDVNETANPDETTSQPAAQCEDLPINILKAGMISRATQTDELPLPSVNKTTQTSKYKQRISKKHCKTIGLQTSMATTLTSSVDSKKRKFKQVELEEDDIKDSSSEDDSTDDEMDSDYDPNDDHDDYSSDEDNQIEESKMEPFSDRSKPHKEYFMTNYYFYCQYAIFVYQLKLM